MRSRVRQTTGPGSISPITLDIEDTSQSDDEGFFGDDRKKLPKETNGIEIDDETNNQTDHPER